MLTLEEALERVLAAIPPLGSETVPVGASFGRVLADNVRSPINLPVFDNSAMDGYAVRSADLIAASSERPVSLRIVAKVAAGAYSEGAIAAGECVRLFTGSRIPAGADAVVMQEDVTAAEATVRVEEPVRPFENIRLCGEDLKAGALIASQGDRINATRVGVLAATGVSALSVSRRPSVALLATGSELREPGQPLGIGEIYESNRFLLAALLTATGAEVTVLPLQADNLEGTEAALRRAFETADLVVSTGGVSVGEFDFVKDAFTRTGGKIDLWRVAIRPGKPFVFGQIGAKFLFGLPGNPVSALVTFLLLARPAILKLQGCRELSLPRVQGVLAEPVYNRGDRRHFVRVRCAGGVVTVCGPQASHMISSLVQANGLLDLPPGARLEAGQSVEVQCWELPV